MQDRPSFSLFILNTITHDEISTPDLIAIGLAAGYTNAMQSIHTVLRRFKKEGLITTRKIRIPSRKWLPGGPRFYSYWRLPEKIPESLKQTPASIV